METNRPYIFNKDALETGDFTGEIWSELKKVEERLVGPGRPALPDDEKRKPRSVKMSDQEWQELQRRASEAGISVAEYIRGKVLAGD